VKRTLEWIKKENVEYRQVDLGVYTQLDKKPSNYHAFAWPQNCFGGTPQTHWPQNIKSFKEILARNSNYTSTG